MTNRSHPIAPKRNRQSIPSGVVVGRIGKGSGHEELISIDSLGAALAQGSNPVAATVNKQQFEFLGFYGQGLFTANQVFDLADAALAMSFPAIPLTYNEAICNFPATVTTYFYLVDNLVNFLADGVSNIICVVQFTAGSSTGTFTWNSGLTVTKYQKLWLVSSSADASLAEVRIIFAGNPA